MGKNVASACAKIIAICVEEGILYEKTWDAFGIVSKKLKIKLNPELPERTAHKEAEAKIAEICEEYDIEYSVLYNDKVSKLLPKGLEVVLSKGLAFDETEENLIKRHIKSGSKFIGVISPTIHTYDFNLGTGKDDGFSVRAFSNCTNIRDSSWRYPTLSKIMEDARNAAERKPYRGKDTLLEKIPLVNFWIAKRRARQVEAEVEEARVKYEESMTIDIGDDILRIAGIPGYEKTED